MCLGKLNILCYVGISSLNRVIQSLWATDSQGQLSHQQILNLTKNQNRWRNRLYCGSTKSLAGTFCTSSEFSDTLVSAVFFKWKRKNSSIIFTSFWWQEEITDFSIMADPLQRLIWISRCWNSSVGVETYCQF